MKSKSLSIRYKFIIIYLVSALISAISTFFLFFLFLLINYKQYTKVTVWINNHAITFLSIMILIFIVLMAMFFLSFTKKEMMYLDEITETVQNISENNLESNIPIKTSDEFGNLAETINNMSSKLNTLIKEERNWERSKNELITNVSHDLRTPLTSVLGYLELISNQKYADDVQLQHYVDIAYTKCTNLKGLIDDLFEYSKLNNKELKINKTKIKINELLEQVVLGFIPVFKEASMDYKISSSNNNIFVEADPVLMARLFDNLINNAIKYGKEGKYLNIELLSEGHEAIVRIMNYGETIPKEDLPYIFERLYRAEKSRSSNKSGSGLGLAIVKSIIDIHNGKIEVTSKDNKTIFEVRLKLN
ncbi:HAMP domain-containing histidine kinase [Clostridium sp. P21]|uniref:histidine kinase n=1 Tax=Clostridium muellerianum TaxID=2716538 RepID=A0A7Y0EHT3_9CLOT|nr:HAMP domain-containing sensor histidine kinase [Clostridium muellerianum]NMM63731.1 HAMP domain-containing histidine kinase [Clostridium muellerianum]